MKITGNGRARLQSCPPVLTGPRRFVFSQRQPSRNQTICLAFSLRPSRLSGEKALSGINREDAKSAKNPRRRILSKRQRICTLVVQETRRKTGPFVALWPMALFLFESGKLVADRPGRYGNCGPKIRRKFRRRCSQPGTRGGPHRACGSGGEARLRRVSSHGPYHGSASPPRAP